MNILITPPEQHFDKGLGLSAWNFRESAKHLLEYEHSRDLFSPISYLQRHAIELYLKSIIYILHKKYQIPFGETYNLDRPAIFINGKWISLSNTHNLADLYKHLLSVLNSCSELLPEDVDWSFAPDINKKINFISGYDPKSTYFRYPESNIKNQNQDQKKSTVQTVNKDSFLKDLEKGTTGPVKCTFMLDTEGNIVEVYDLVAEPLKDVKKALSEIVEELHRFHCTILGELTRFS